ATNPLLNTWSLSVEEQFYLVFPLILIGGWMLVRRWRRMRQAPAVLVLSVAIGSFALAVVGALEWTIPGIRPELIGFYSPFSRAWEFAVGALVALAIGRLTVSSRSLATALGVAGALALAGSLWIITDSTPFPGPWTLLPVGATLLLLIAGTQPSNVVTRALATRPMTAAGDWSYSIYLWHWPLIAFTALIWPGSGLALILAAALSFAPAIASYTWVEQPIRAIRGASRGRLARIVIVTVTPPLALGTGLWVAAQNGFWLAPVQQYQAAVSHVHSGQVAGCDSTTPQGDRPVGACVWNADSTGAPLYLVGDSHAGHLTEAVVGAGEQTGRPVVISTTNACPYIEVDWSVPSLGAPWNDQCRSYVSGTAEWLATQPPGTVVVSATAGYWLNPDYQFPTTAGQDAPGPDEREVLYTDALRKTVVDLYKAGHNVVLVQDSPRGLSNPQLCSVPMIVRGDCTQSAPLDQFLSNREVDRRIIDTVSSDTGADVLDLLDALCPDSTCSSRRGDVVLYRDNDHLSVAASASLAPLVASMLDTGP
ncbi:MAG: hypothetical protein QG661_2543, partial [Actinomycetota bacterium]|nr:hypothetical protein [Actinomycetota bacterium]